MHNRKREESIPLVYHPCAKFTRGQLHANMSELACGQLSMYNHMHSGIDGHTTLTVEWGVDILIVVNAVSYLCIDDTKRS